MTLLVLPLVEITNEIDTSRIWHSLAEQSDLFLSFVISFVVIYLFWGAHAAAVRSLLDRGLDLPLINSLTMIWMLLIAFLPFPTAIVGRHLDTVSAPIYIGTLLLLSVLTSVIGTLAGRAVPTTFSLRFAWLTTAVFAVSACISAFNAALGMYSLLVLVLLRVLEASHAARHTVADPVEAPTDGP